MVDNIETVMWSQKNIEDSSFLISADGLNYELKKMINALEDLQTYCHEHEIYEIQEMLVKKTKPLEDELNYFLDKFNDFKKVINYK